MTQQNSTSKKHAAEALFDRGVAHLRGDGVPQDYEQALCWLSKALEAGSNSAAIVLAEMHEAGLGTPRNMKKASALFGSSKKRSGFVPLMRPITSSTTRSIESPLRIDDRQSKQHLTANPSKCIECGAETLAFSTDCRCANCETRSYLPIAENNLRNGFAIQPYREKTPDGKTLTFSFLGECVHTLKYNEQIDDQFREKLLQEISTRIATCGVIERLIPQNVLNDIIAVPAPFTKKRTLQPVLQLVKYISENRFAFDDPLRKYTKTESKNRPKGTELEPNEIACVKRTIAGRNVLLVDDTYGEGATLRACIRALKEKGAQDIYFLSLCKNLYGGVKGGA